MKSYEEIAKSVFERRDAYIAQRKKRMATIGKLSSIGAGFCCIMLIALSINKSELSDVQQYKEYVGNPTESTTMPQTGTNSPPANGITVGSDGIVLPSGEVFSQPVITPDGEVIGVITPSGDYIYVIQDPTEAPSENDPTEALSEHGTTGGITESGTSVNTESSGETQDSSAPTNKWPDTLLDGGMHFSTDPTEASSEDTGVNDLPMLPTGPTESPTTAVTEYQGPTYVQVITQPLTEQQKTTIIELLTQKNTSDEERDDYPTPEVPDIIYDTYNKFRLSGSKGVYRVTSEKVKASDVGRIFESGVIIYDSDNVTYVKADIYLIKNTPETFSIAVKYEGRDYYYTAYYSAG